jgi:hypothetical protein
VAEEESLYMKRYVLGLAILGLLFFGQARPAGAAIVTYTSQAAFEAAVGTTFTEPFDSGGLQSFTGVVSTVGHIGPARGVLTGSVWNDRPTLSGGESTTFSYLPGPLLGAGALWDTSPGGEGQGLALTINLVGGGTESVGSIGPIDGTFFGFTSTDAFVSFTIKADGNPGVAETYDMDNLEFAPQAVAPEPATVSLLALGIAGMAGYGWRRRTLAAV